MVRNNFSAKPKTLYCFFIFTWDSPSGRNANINGDSIVNILNAITL
jgi:hypothetical protein